MEQSEKRQELIDNYLLSRLSKTEQEALHARSMEDPLLSAEIAATAQAIEAVSAFNDQQLKGRFQALERQLQTTEASGSQVTKPSKTGKVVALNFRRYAAAAAAVLLLVIATWWLLPSSSSSLGAEAFAANFSPYRNIAVSLTRSGEAVSAEESAYTAYEAADWEQAATLLEGLPETAIHNFYRAQVALQRKDFSRAITWLQPLSTADFALQAEANWYLALAYVGQDQPSEAIPLLEAISATTGHPFQAQAAALLRK